MSTAALTQSFDVSQVLSDDKHYSPFICNICQNLVSLDVVVTSPCSHPFCRRCMEMWARECSIRKKDCFCPTCKTDITRQNDQQPQFTEVGSGTDDTTASLYMQCGSVEIKARPLKEAQPLAFRVLTLVQVACIDNSPEPCDWSGDYGKFVEHVALHQSATSTSTTPSTATTAAASQGAEAELCTAAATAAAVAGSIATATSSGTNSKTSGVPLSRLSGGRPTALRSPIRSSKRSRPPVTSKTGKNRQPGMLARFKSLSVPHFRKEDLQQDESVATDNPATERGHDSLVTRNEGGNQGSGNVDSSLIETMYNNLTEMEHEQDESENADTNNNIASGSNLVSQTPRSPVSPTTPSTGTPAAAAAAAAAAGASATRDAPPIPVSRKISMNSTIAKGKQQYMTAASTSTSPAAQRRQPEGALCLQPEWNTSINSLAYWNDSIEQKTIELMDEDSSNGGNGTTSVVTGVTDNTDAETLTSPEEKAKIILERADKLRKQANAKFNKGDFTTARSLYTEGIHVMDAIVAVDEGELKALANMHSNRAVTYFREKDFNGCIADCEKAIQYDPTHEKSWIRKWRALMALGEVDEAYSCLEEGVHAAPEAKKLVAELEEAREELDVLNNAKDLISKGSYEAAKATLLPLAEDTTNISIVCTLARAEMGLGETEAALEHVNKTLTMNPTYAEGLETRGLIFFCAGQTEKSAHVLYDAYCVHQTNKILQKALTRCQKTHSALMQARSCIKRGRYEEAVERFANAIKECGPIGMKTTLYSILHTELAEALLFSYKYEDALSELENVLDAQNQYSPGWVVKAEVMVALGRSNEIRQELDKIRRTWGKDDADIDDAYRRVDFELRVLKADSDLEAFLSEMENGTSQRFSIGSLTDHGPPSGNDSLKSGRSMSRSNRDDKVMKRAASVRGDYGRAMEDGELESIGSEVSRPRMKKGQSVRSSKKPSRHDDSVLQSDDSARLSDTENGAAGGADRKTSSRARPKNRRASTSSKSSADSRNNRPRMKERITAEGLESLDERVSVRSGGGADAADAQAGRKPPASNRPEFRRGMSESILNSKNRKSRLQVQG